MNILVLISLLLCLALAALWVRSHRMADGLFWSDGVRVPTAGYNLAWRQMFISADGRLYYIQDRSMGATGPISPRRLSPEVAAFVLHLSLVPSGTPQQADVFHRFAGFIFSVRHGYPMIASTRFGPPVELTRLWAVPYWFFFALTAVLPSVWFRADLRRRRSTRLNICPNCGYDLRATPERCPECGTEPAPAR